MSEIQGEGAGYPDIDTQEGTDVSTLDADYGTDIYEGGDNLDEFGEPTVPRQPTAEELKQSNLTKWAMQNAEKERALAAREAEVARQIAYLQGQQEERTRYQNPAKEPVSRVEALVSKVEAENPESGAFLRELMSAQAEDIEARHQSEMRSMIQPIQQNNAIRQADTALEGYLVGQLIPEYGDGVKEIWPQVKAMCIQQGKLPQEVIALNFPQQNRALLYAQEDKLRKQQLKQRNAASMEGTTTMRREGTPGSDRYSGSGNPKNPPPFVLDSDSIEEGWNRVRHNPAAIARLRSQAR